MSGYISTELAREAFDDAETVLINGDLVVQLRSWRKAYMKRRGITVWGETPRRAFSRARKALLASGHITQPYTDGYVKVK